METFREERASRSTSSSGLVAENDKPHPPPFVLGDDWPRKRDRVDSFPKTAGPRNKSGVLNALSEATGLKRKEVATVTGALTALIANDMAKIGTFTLPGLAKMSVIRKPATKARSGINPFTKEPTIFKAKPARKIVKIRPLKALKDFVK